jgi:hypothetical protein
MDYIPTRTWEGNKVYMLSSILAHNVSRELQMISALPERSTEENAPLCGSLRN